MAEECPLSPAQGFKEDGVARGDVLQVLDVDGAGVPVEGDDSASLLGVGIPIAKRLMENIVFEI